MPKYARSVFYDKLIEILKHAHAQKCPRKSIKAGELHDAVVAPEDSYKKTGNHCVPRVCGVMKELKSYQGGKASIVDGPPSKQGPQLEIEFDTADLPE